MEVLEKAMRHKEEKGNILSKDKSQIPNSEISNSFPLFTICKL